jgi:hypothetical protein
MLPWGEGIDTLLQKTESVVQSARLANIERFLSGRAWYFFIGVVLTLQSLLVLSHKPWLDEWQALQIALQSPDFLALLENLRYEGHPPLWYLVLQITAITVPAGFVLKAAALPIALTSQLILLLRAPFLRTERLLLATGFFILFDFTVLSRSLSLGVMLLLIATAYRKQRWSWVAVSLLPLTDFLFGVLSIGFVIIAWKEQRLWRPGIALWIICGFIAAWSVRPASDMLPALLLNGPVEDSIRFIARLGALLLPLHMTEGQLVWNALPPLGLALPAGVGWLAFSWLILKDDRFSASLFFSFTAITFLFSIAVYPLAIRHLSLAVILLVLLLWRLREAGGPIQPMFLGWASVASACGLVVAGYSLFVPFDNAEAAARYIEEQGLRERHWVSFPDSRAQGVSALLGIEFERLEQSCTQSFIRWNYRTRIKKTSEMEEEMAKIAARQGSFYLLSDFLINPAKLERPQDFRLLIHIPAGYDGQHYVLYHVRPDLEERAERPPQCEPQRLPLRVGAR